MASSNRAIAILTRVPSPGRTKTRMMPDLTPDECAQVHAGLLRDTVATCNEADADVVVFFTPEGDADLMRSLLGRSAVCRPQKGDGLGARMREAMRCLFEAGYRSCLLMGADSPEVTVVDLNEAFRLLAVRDVVVGPTFDGGFYAIGMNALHEEVLSLPAYGTDQVFKDTCSIVGRKGLALGLMRKLHDLDTFEDLCGLRFRIEAGATPPMPETRATLACIVGDNRG